jgi:universal stress protein A
MYNHIMLATDLSDENQDTLEKAKQLSGLFGSKLSLYHAVEPIPNYGYVGIADLEDQLVDEAKQGLAKQGEQLGVDPADQWVSVGPAKREILATARELGIDLIIIGSHTGVHLSEILGSTTNGVLHHSHCDVVTVRHGDKK